MLSTQKHKSTVFDEEIGAILMPKRTKYKGSKRGFIAHEACRRVSTPDEEDDTPGEPEMYVYGESPFALFVDREQ